MLAFFLSCSEGFRSLKEEEEVEFEISDNGGKSKAINVTGPAGAYVQGAPRRNNRGEIRTQDDDRNIQAGTRTTLTA